MTTPTAMVGVVVFFGKYKYCKYANLNTPQPNLLLEGCRYNARQKKCGWAVLKCTAHSHFLLLAAVDVCLITINSICCQKS